MRLTLQDYHSLLQELEEHKKAVNQYRIFHDIRKEVMLEFLRYLKNTPYFKDIMDEFNKDSERLTLFIDEDKQVKLKINGEDA